MDYRQILHRTWQDNVLFSVMLELTYHCNLDCFFCYNDEHAKGQTLRLDDYQVLLNDLQEFGTMNIALTGGEPLNHPDFFAIGSHARELGFVVRIKSNGHALSRRTARRIQQEIDPFVIEISLHGACAKTHDRQTRVPGSFDQLMKNIQHMLDLGLRLKLNSTLTAWNENEIDAMFALADSFGVRLQFDPQVTPKDDGDQQPLDISASNKALAHLFDVNAKRASKARADEDKNQYRTTDTNEDKDDKPGGGKHCGAGSSTLHIDPFGNVFPCVQWRHKLGNLRDSRIRDIWYESETLTKVRLKTQHVRKMLDANVPSVDNIVFCPALAEELTGSPLKLYPGVKQRLAVQTAVDDEKRKP